MNRHRSSKSQRRQVVGLNILVVDLCILPFIIIRRINSIKKEIFHHMQSSIRSISFQEFQDYSDYIIKDKYSSYEKTSIELLFDFKFFN